MKIYTNIQICKYANRHVEKYKCEKCIKATNIQKCMYIYIYIYTNTKIKKYIEIHIEKYLFEIIKEYIKNTKHKNM